MLRTKKISVWLVLLFLGMLGTTRSLFAQDKTVITSDSLLFDYKRSIAVFEGNVKVEDPQVTMTCSKLYVYFDSNNQIDSVVARENVHIVQGDRNARSHRAVYRASDGSIVLTEDARLYRGSEELRGDEIQIFTHSEKVIAKPARLVVTPGRGMKELAP